MSVGVYSNLLAMLSVAPSLSGVSLSFGEETNNAQEYPLPWVNVVPTGGAWAQPGYAHDENVNENSQGWTTSESIDLYCWAFDPSVPIDTPSSYVLARHADQTIDLLTNVLQAFQNQTDNANPNTGAKLGGLMFRPQSGRWQTMQNADNRYGRAYVLTVGIDITIPDFVPPEVICTEVTLNPISI